jgi:hypothetical protein
MSVFLLGTLDRGIELLSWDGVVAKEEVVFLLDERSIVISIECI